MFLSLKINILLVEKEQDGLLPLKAKLEKSACNVFSIRDENKVFHMLAKHDFAIIFIVVNSDCDEAINLVGRIHEAEQSKYTPVIFISEDKIKDEDILKGYNAGAVDFLVLPVENEIIESKILAFTEMFRLRMSAEIIAGERLKKSEEKYKSLFDTSRDGIAFISIVGNIEKANKAYCELLGYDLEELIFTTSAEHTPLRWHKRDMEILESQVMQRGYSDEYKKEYIRKNKTVFPVMVRTWLVRDEQGQPLRYLKMVRDITEQTLLEEKLRQSHKMESIGTIAGGIAHDFNNILGAIIGYAQLAKYDIPEGNSAAEDIESIIAASDRAKELVNHILSFSRLSEQVMQPVHLHYIVNEVFKLIRATFPSTIEIIRRVTSRSTSIMADSTEMHQVIMNLCTNAFHAMEKDGGVLEICLDSVDISAADLAEFPELTPGGYVKLSVRDTGCGIESEIIDQIFDSYFTTKEKGTGTGLGLAVVNGIIKNHHGFINVKSHVGLGTEIVVFFPRIDAADRTIKNISYPLLTGTETLLIVDDEPALVHVEKSMLQRLGYRVISKDSGIEAFETFSKKPDFFDLVITDMTMPGMTGLELSRKITELKANIPIILCTGYNNKITDESAKQTGIAKVLLKPLEIRELALAIRELVGGQPPI